MPKSESITIRDQSGATQPGIAQDCEQFSDAFRKATGTLYIVGGFVLGLGCLIVPTPHIFVTTWLFPLLGIYLGMRAFKRRVMIYDVVGTCPSCEKPIELNGGSIDEPAWQKCPECDATLTFTTALAPAETRTAP